MLNKLFFAKKINYKPLTILIIEPNPGRRAFLGRAIELRRPNHKILAVDSWEQVFSLIYGEIELDLIFFDIETEQDTQNIKIVRAISPNTAFVHWSNYKHPEVVELLNELGVKTFCLKDSQPKIIVEAIDTVEKNPNILYIDERLNNCLPLLNS
ncbi:MAG: DNA-binding response regulator [Xenococcus sp. (in: cyanobacteria)]